MGGGREDFSKNHRASLFKEDLPTDRNYLLSARSISRWTVTLTAARHRHDRYDRLLSRNRKVHNYDHKLDSCCVYRMGGSPVARSGGSFRSSRLGSRFSLKSPGSYKHRYLHGSCQLNGTVAWDGFFTHQSRISNFCLNIGRYWLKLNFFGVFLYYLWNREKVFLSSRGHIFHSNIACPPPPPSG